MIDHYDEKIAAIRDRAVIRVIDLTSKKIDIKRDLEVYKSDKKIKALQIDLEYTEKAIADNRDIIFSAANIDKDYQLEQ